jgi:hypothetical protein
VESLKDIFSRVLREVEEYGFKGDASTPVIWNGTEKSHIKHATKHAHDLTGKCVKSKFGFCN